MIPAAPQLLVPSRRIIVPSGGAYTAQGVRFDGTNDYQTQAGFSGAVDGKVGICNFWFKMTGGDGSFQAFVEDDNANFSGLQFLRFNDNTIRLQGLDSFSTVGFRMFTTSTFAVGMNWTNLLAAWDTHNSIAKVYINDSDNTAAGATFTDVAIDYTVNWTFFARFTPSLIVDAEIADFYLNTAEFLDITNTANRRKFISAGLAPVDLGATGSLPTGTAPLVFFHGPTASWHTNDGTGGGTTLHGALTDAATNPP